MGTRAPKVREWKQGLRIPHNHLQGEGREPCQAIEPYLDRPREMRMDQTDRTSADQASQGGNLLEGE